MGVIKIDFPRQAQPPRPRPFEEIVPSDATAHQADAGPAQSLEMSAEQARSLAELPMVVGQSVRVVDPANRALELAQRHDFFEMCAPVLWGNETQAKRELFGELLRSLVVTYLPTGVHDLLNLKSVAAAQWRLNRLLEIQGNLFSAHAESDERNKQGIPKATTYALEINDQIDKAQAAVARAIDTFYLSRRMSKKTSEERRT